MLFLRYAMYGFKQKKKILQNAKARVNLGHKVLTCFHKNVIHNESSGRKEVKVVEGRK